MFPTHTPAIFGKRHLLVPDPITNLLRASGTPTGVNIYWLDVSREWRVLRNTTGVIVASTVKGVDVDAVERALALCVDVEMGPDVRQCGSGGKMRTLGRRVCSLCQRAVAWRQGVS